MVGDIAAVLRLAVTDAALNTHLAEGCKIPKDVLG